MPDEPPEAEKPEPARGLVLSEDLPLTIFVGVSTAVVFSLINLSSEWTLLGVATAPLVADVIKNHVAGRWTKRRLLFLTALLVFFSRVKEALARIGLRPIPPAGPRRRSARRSRSSPSRCRSWPGARRSSSTARRRSSAAISKAAPVVSSSNERATGRGR